MLNLITGYWWIILPVAAVTAYYTLRAWARWKFDSAVKDVLEEAQSNFARGTVRTHSISSEGTQTVDGEVAMLYTIDATICPTDGQVQWAPADLFLRGVDEDGDENPMQMGEVRAAKLWNGSSFDSVKLGTQFEGEQRVELRLLLAGEPNRVRFNYNFACFGSIIELPEVQAELATA